MIIADELLRRFEPVSPWDFYHEIFADGQLDAADAFTPGKYTAIALEITKDKKPNGKTLVKRHTITDDLDGIDALMASENFCILAPVSYAGKSRKSENARVMYALCVELDDLKVGVGGAQDGLWDLVYQWEGPSKLLPQPTFLVASGSGVHLYYVFERPLVLFPNVVKGLMKYKHELTNRIWNRYVTNSYKKENIQFESIFQAFRMPGTLTKKGERAQAFRVGERVSIEYMNSFIPASYAKKGAQIPDAYKSNVSLKEAQAKWPDWYERRIVQGDKRVKKWDIAGKVHGDNPYALYDWWYNKILTGAHDGNRYHCLWTLVIYALKCDVPEERIEDDCFELMERFDKLTKKEDNPFTEYDVMCALQAYSDGKLIQYPINSIMYKTGIPIEKNKRNGRKQAVHLKGARALQAINDEANGTNWREGNGRPKGSGTAQKTISEWRKENPGGTKKQCKDATGLTYPTIRKWWDSKLDSNSGARIITVNKEEYDWNEWLLDEWNE